VIAAPLPFTGRSLDSRRTPHIPIAGTERWLPEKMNNRNQRKYMGNITHFPTEERQLTRDVERVRQWTKSYKSQQIQDDFDMLQRLEDLATALRVSLGDHIIASTAPPEALRTALILIEDVRGYLPDRISHAVVLDELYPEVAARIPRYPTSQTKAKRARS